MLVLGPAVGQEKHAGGCQAVDQAVEQCLGLGIDPVEVLEQEQEGLDLALAQQEALDSVQHELAALGRIEPFPPGLLDRNVEQAEERRQAGF
jgi:hypothetical protein